MPTPVKSILEAQLARKEQLEQPLPWRLLFLMLALLAITVSVYAAMEFFYQPYLDSNIKSIESSITNLNQEIESPRANEVLTLYFQLASIKNLLESHTVPSKIVDFLSRNTDNSVYYTEMKLSVPDKKLSLSGIASSYAGLVRQLEILRQADEVKSFALGRASQDRIDQVQFSLEILLKPSIFQK